MNRKLSFFQNIIISTFIYSFIVLYFLYIIYLYSSHYFEISFIILIGFVLIIVGIFLFFVYLKNDNNLDEIVFHFKVLNENITKIIMMAFMGFAYFIPPISFTTTVMDWSQIGLYNYFRAAIFLIGCVFLPGACLFKILFPKTTLPEKFKVEPFLIKLTIYPLLSFTFFGTITLILDQMGLLREYFTPVLFLIILFLFFLDIFVQKYRSNENLGLRIIKINLSKSTLFILFLALGVIIVALGFSLKIRYLMSIDPWDGIEPANNIGYINKSLTDVRTYEILWGCVSFSLSALSGIPLININTLLFPFLYLYVTSVYLLMKAILLNLKQNYAVLATIFVLIFSGLFYSLNFYEAGMKVSLLVISGLFCFNYKSFPIFLLFVSIALFIISAKTSENIKPIFKSEKFITIFLGAWFLIQSYMIYYLPVIPAVSLIIIYNLFSKEKKKLFLSL